MRVDSHENQYGTPFVVLEASDDGRVTPDQVRAFCHHVGAVLPDHEGDDPENDVVYVIELRSDVGPELWTPRALVDSLRRRLDPDQSTT